MDYTKHQDLTDRPGRRYKVTGDKSIITCPMCKGSVTQYVEDTVYRCNMHGNTPLIIKSGVFRENAMCP